MKQPLKMLLKTGRSVLNDMCLDPIDRRFGSQRTSAVPVFILGAPRCGSTLLTQLITQYLDVGYFSNLHAHLYGSPQFAEYLLKLVPETRSHFVSEYGVTKGLRSPSENAAYWYRFFRRKPAYVSLEEMPDHQGHAFANSMRRFLTTVNKPVIIKNLYATQRLEVIQHYLPEAKFIVLKRDRGANAASLLNSRFKHFGRYDRWWSVEPPDYQHLRSLDPVSQVLGQIDSIYSLIERTQKQQRREISSFLHLNYEALCSDPHALIRRVGKFLQINLGNKEDLSGLPQSFENRRSVVEHPILDEELRRRVES